MRWLGWVIRMRAYFKVLLLCGGLLAGCSTPFSEVPHATKFEASGQPKLQSAYHWQLIADDAARELLQQLERTRCVPNQPVCSRGLHEGTKLYIKPKVTDNQFHRAIKLSLMNALLKANVYRLTKNPYGSNVLTVDVDTEYVRWADRARRDPLYGEMTLLASGLWVMRNASTDAALLSAGVTADAYFSARAKRARGPQPQHELMLSTTVADSEYYYAQSLNLYYTTERDFHSLYAKKKPPPDLPRLPSGQVRVVE